MARLITAEHIRTDRTYGFIYSYKGNKFKGKIFIATGESTVFINGRLTPITYVRQECEFDNCPDKIIGDEYRALKEKIIKAVKRSIKKRGQLW